MWGREHVGTGDIWGWGHIGTGDIWGRGHVRTGDIWGRGHVRTGDIRGRGHVRTWDIWGRGHVGTGDIWGRGHVGTGDILIGTETCRDWGHMEMGTCRNWGQNYSDGDIQVVHVIPRHVLPGNLLTAGNVPRAAISLPQRSSEGRYMLSKRLPGKLERGRTEELLPWRLHLLLHLSLNREGRWGTTHDFTTNFLHFSLFSTALWDLANSRPVHFFNIVFPPLFLSSTPFLYFTKWFLPDLMNGRHVHSTSVCVILRWSAGQTPPPPILNRSLLIIIPNRRD